MVMTTPVFKNSMYENALTFLNSAASIMIILLAAPKIVRLPAIVLAASIVHWEI